MSAKYHDWMMMDDKDSRSTSWTSAMKEYYKYKHILLYNFSFTLVKICLIENQLELILKNRPFLFWLRIKVKNCTLHWSKEPISALFQLDSTSAELFYGLLLQKGKGQKDLFLFLVIEFAQFCLLSRSPLVRLAVINFSMSKMKIEEKEKRRFFFNFHFGDLNILK